MRVLLVSHDFLPNHPLGTEVYTWQLGVRLRERGHDVHVFTTDKDVSRPQLSLERREWDGLAVHELTNNLFYDDFRETWDWPPAVEAFGRILDDLRPDVVHVMHLLYLSAGCVHEARRRGLPVFYTLHDFWLQCARFGQRIHADGARCDVIDFERCGTCLVSLKYAQSALERKTAQVLARVRGATGLDLKGAAQGAASLLRRATGGEPTGEEQGGGVPAGAVSMARAMATRDAELRQRVVPDVERFFAPSRFLRQAFLDWGIPAHQIEHLEYGLELEPFTNFERRPSETLRVAYLGSLAPHKAPHLLLEAWGRLPNELRAGASLRIVGPKEHHPDYVADLERRAAALGVELPGGVARERVPELLSGIDLLVVPSVWYENSPFTIHEARATRTPLLVSDLGGMAELVRDGREGWTFDVGDAADLTRHLTRILMDPASLARLPFDGAPVKDMQSSAAEMEERYEAALGGAGAP